MPLLYHSTRGQAPELDLRGVTMAGLAADGGLYLPKSWPQFSAADLAGMRGKPYAEVAFRVLRLFCEGVIADADLRRLLTNAYASFGDEAVTPLKTVGDMQVLELFHGPTLAFKDVALQLLGGVFEHFLAESGRRITVIGATSGDTGSAAMAALAERKNVDVFILYPQKGPSEIQRKQMTCIAANNVHAVAVEGNFDDCQAIVKSLFNDAEVRATYNLAAVNSINWLRILAQMVYYFYAAAQSQRPSCFVVPTGNFGNVFAGYAAMRCGLPVAKLAVASNRNDILTRFFATGRMQAESVQSSLSPSMDIQVSSNFERLLFELCGGSGKKVQELMDVMRDKGEFSLTPEQMGQARTIFTAGRADDDVTLATITDVYKKTGYILDPHSAVGVAVARRLKAELPDPVICLACAHPAKFPDTIRRAISITPALPAAVENLLQGPERTVLLPANRLKIIKFMAEKLH